MNKSAFLELVQQASAISDQQTEELEKVAATFPYCQTAHLLLAKSAHDKGSMLSTQRLRRASAYASNRQVLKRLIYASPSPAPVFEEAASEDMAVAVKSPHAAHQDNTFIPAVSEEVIYKEEAVTDPPEVTVADEVAAPEQETSPPQGSHIYVEAPQAEEATADNTSAEEVSYYELAHLLTINSLSPSFTDLLAQRPAPEVPKKAPSETPEPGQNMATALDTAGEVPLPPADFGEHPSSPVAEETNAPETSVDEHPDVVPATSPEAAPISYSFSEIDQMYADDALGYWMASSRMGEMLQLKDEVTRQRPAAFHPELILEYTKTHVLEEKPREQQAAALHHQYSIIDQFLKLNPRLNTMQHVKMKQEPQEDLSLRNSKIKKGIASESLANIFLNQGKVKKAIKIYEQLLLKYPEKKSYFAGQIEKLQNLS
ncbi:hypothetical protein [Pontibacter russatus]|uniref:hypothetical protein n=1 Tax=Pontibacter russatus TaxID=2694929 RepID=UPI00137AFF4A|nr:hypothetical protein [Pontibacter russatus]